MPRIAEKLEFMTGRRSRSVKKQILEERQAIKSHVISNFSQERPRKRKLLIVQDDFGKIIDVIRRKLCFLSD